MGIAGLGYLVLGIIAIEVVGFLSILPPLWGHINRSFDEPTAESQLALARTIREARPYVLRACFLGACLIGLWIGFISGNNPLALLLFLGYRWLLTRAVKARPTRQYWLILAITIWGCMISAATSTALLR